MKYFWDTVTSVAYWRYVLFSRSGIQALLSIAGAIWLIIEVLDFFKIYTRDEYGKYGFAIVLLFSGFLAILIRRPITSIEVRFPEHDFSLEVRIGDLFDAAGAVVISSNTVFESDVANGKIDPNSLQGQFVAKYFTGDQGQLIKEIQECLIDVGQRPYPLGTTVPINTHGKTFYLLAMSELNTQGNARSTPEGVDQALGSFWRYIRESGALQELAVPVFGTARGRLNISRKKMIERISQSYAEASRQGKFTDRLVIVVHPNDARKFQVNLYDIKDHLTHTLERI
jgi:hypothetical protein